MTIHEANLALKLGLSRGEIKIRRGGMVKGIDWILDEKRQVQWTEEGVGKLGLDAPPGEVVCEPPSSDGAAVVVRCNFRNSRLLHATIAGVTRLVLVRDARMYVPGQKIAVRPNGAGLMESHRPRTKGKS